MASELKQIIDQLQILDTKVDGIENKFHEVAERVSGLETKDLKERQARGEFEKHSSYPRGFISNGGQAGAENDQEVRPESIGPAVNVWCHR